jgi:hypothetical protein
MGRTVRPRDEPHSADGFVGGRAVARAGDRSHNAHVSGTGRPISHESASSA